MLRKDKYMKKKVGWLLSRIKQGRHEQWLLTVKGFLLGVMKMFWNQIMAMVA
jgi:hypothetical protein